MLSHDLRLLRDNYQDKLDEANIPRDPEKRTLDQVGAASLLWWAAQNEIALNISTADQSLGEVK